MKAILFLSVLTFSVSNVFGADECHASDGKNKSVRVELSQGTVEGYIARSRDGHEYEAFEGIPYGKVIKRFADPVPADNWTGVLSTKERTTTCYNTGMFSLGKVTGSEDCLKLDVYTPYQASSTKELLPVMVWFYGGGFLEGATNQYGPDYFMDIGSVVIVMVNYRLGAFGFLNCATQSARGNQGMKDQVLALKWVQENIEKWNGDKNLVTIFGESAGSISVALHLTSPMSAGLFHRAIMQSGPLAMPYMYNMADGWSLAEKLGKRLDCPTAEPEGLVKCLQRIDPIEFGRQVQMMGEYGFNPDSIGMGPSYETYSEGENDQGVFMKGDPYHLAEKGEFNKVPIVIGIAAHESIMSASLIKGKHLNKLNRQWSRHAPKLLFLNEDAEDPALTADAIKEQFITHREGEKAVITDDATLEIEALMSERHWVHPFRLTAAAFAKYTPVFMYNFTLNPVITRNKDIPAMFKPFVIQYPEDQKRRLPSHADDLPYLFNVADLFKLIFGDITTDHEDYIWSKEFLKAWISFAKTGKFSSSPWKEWKPIEGGDALFTSSYLEIDNPPKFTQVPSSWESNHKFWEGLNLKSWGGKWPSEA